MKRKGAKISIVMGSDSDLPIMEEAASVCKKFGIKHEMIISSAHRSPDLTAEFAKNADRRGIKVIIAGAGYSAHLAGVIASHTILPVIGVPLAASPLMGMDALMAMSQMPAGIPVATVTMGRAGAKNAALLAAEILALEDDEIAIKLDRYRKDMAAEIIKKDESV